MRLQLKPAEPLLERELSALLGISRTPIREALLLLEREGWVASGERKGFVVTAISPADVDEICSLRRANECLAVELALPRLSAADLAHLEGLFARQETLVATDREEFVRTDRELHAYLADRSGNQRLAALLQNLSDHTLRFGIAALTRAGRTQTTQVEHRRLLDALARKDPVDAVAAMTAHLANTQAAIVAALSTSAAPPV